MAIGAGYCVSLMEIPISATLSRTINMLAMSSTAVALFVIGGALVGLRVQGMVRDVSAVALGKTMLHPFVIGSLMWFTATDASSLRAAAVVYSSIPTISVYPILAQKYGLESFCAAALIVATLISFLTISATLWVLRASVNWI
jgi:predicted permease